MIYLGIFFLILIFLYLLMIYIRKTMWDAVHRNLLDLEDYIEGKVFQRSFAARPVFHGKMNDCEITINFSAEKKEGKRYNYIDISMAAPAGFNCTLARKSWLQKQNAGELKDFITLKNKNSEEFILRPASELRVKKLVNNDIINKIIDEFQGLAYLFIGKNGMMCELETTEVVRATHHEKLRDKLQLLHQLAGMLP